MQDNFDHQISALNDFNETLKKQFHSKKEESSQLLQSNQEKDSQIEILQKTQAELKEENSNLKSENEQLLSKIATLEQSQIDLKKSFQTEIKQLEDKKLQLEKELSEIELMSKNFIADNLKLETRIVELEQKYESIEEEEEKQIHWQKDSGVTNCPICDLQFSHLKRKVSEILFEKLRTHQTFFKSIIAGDVEEFFVENVLVKYGYYLKSIEKLLLEYVISVIINLN